MNNDRVVPSTPDHSRPDPSSAGMPDVVWIVRPFDTLEEPIAFLDRSDARAYAATSTGAGSIDGVIVADRREAARLINERIAPLLLTGPWRLDERLDQAGYPFVAAMLGDGTTAETILTNLAECLRNDAPEGGQENFDAIVALVAAWFTEPVTQAQILSDPDNDDATVEIRYAVVDGRPSVIVDDEAYSDPSIFWIENRELLEGVRAEDGSWDWENAAMCDPHRGQDPRLQQYVRDLLAVRRFAR
ncbi:hypothetical protein Q5424_01100 [Conexibacter sp. JD483]|uniref:hypothetical protein n=1 Tax=unclassified Conexibacter TaxID=2627773 RepID=UPI0027263098|nr:MULTISPECIES: hypothetical protein [unclassified Conexibacter]MDO8185825.1 hypothetical protein [Conexibacter sp. CPCC 205706]MDO8198569.1 hypothetical protein [Conexibacter sp. CPCC 205762]MDR9367655.1 hypothetical protein [Conexibacter sp. JD483]